MIQHACIYQARQAVPTDGLRVLVMRQWPRGVRKESVDVWLRDAGPGLELLRAYTHAGLPWAEFEAGYRAEIAQRPEILARLRDLEREHGTVTLLCRERIPPAEHCHRLVLLELVHSMSGSGSDRRCP